MYQYRYTQNTCSQCNHVLTNGYDISIHFILPGGNEVCRLSKLTPGGILIDADGLVAQGYHSQTLCAHCGCDLIDIQDENTNWNPRIWVIHYRSGKGDHETWVRVQEETPDVDELAQHIDDYDPENIEVLEPFDYPMPRDIVAN